MTQRRLTAYFYLIVSSIIWGVAGPVIKYTLADFPPLIFLAYRFGLSALIGLVFFLITKPKLPNNPILQARLVIYGFLTSTLSLGLLFLGFAKTNSLQATLLSALAPLFIVAGGALFLKEAISRPEKIGLCIAFLGTLVTVIEPLFLGQPFFSDSMTGNALVIASVVVGSVSALYGKELLNEKFEPILLTHITFIVGFLTVLPATIALYPPDRLIPIFMTASFTSHLGVWYMAILSGSLAYALYHLGQKAIEAGEAAIFNYLLPIWAAPLSIIWLHEPVTPPYLLGAVLIIVGVAVAEYRKRRSKSSLPHRQRGKKLLK